MADLVVLSADYFSIPDEQIKQLESVLTIVGGEVVYATKEFSKLAPQACLSRRRFLRASGACLATAFVPVTTGSLVLESYGLQRWVERNGIRVDAGSNSGGNAREVERLIAAIGKAKVVILGEPSHGAGAAFAAKERLDV
jgi:hypothetical protein